MGSEKESSAENNLRTMVGIRTTHRMEKERIKEMIGVGKRGDEVLNESTMVR